MWSACLSACCRFAKGDLVTEFQDLATAARVGIGMGRSMFSSGSDPRPGFFVVSQISQQTTLNLRRSWVQVDAP